MKQFFYTLLILGLIYFCYWYITRTPDVVAVTGALNILEEKKSENYIAIVNGTATNTGKMPVKKIWITYKIGKDEVTAYIDELPPEKTVKFRTGKTVATIKDPVVELLSVHYEK